MKPDNRKVRRSPAKIPPSLASDLRLRYERGETTLKLASELDVHPRAVTRAIISAGGEVRNRIDAMRIAITAAPRSAKHSERISSARKAAAQSESGRAHLLAISKVGADAIRLEDAERKARNAARLRVKNLLHRALKVTGKGKSSSTRNLLGYDWRDLRRHIESQFGAGMSWGNPGSFHIDHRVPVVQFLKRGVSEPRLINALANLQVLSPSENLAKSSRYDESLWYKDLAAIQESING